MTLRSSHAHLSPSHLALVLTYLNLLVLLLPRQTSDWEYTATITPWLWAICSPPSRAHLMQIAKENRFLVLSAALGSVWILIGTLTRQVTDEWRAASTPILWLPISAILEQSAYQTPTITKRAIQAVLGIAIFSTFFVLAHQWFVDKHPRPPGLSFNVLTGPMLLMMACLFIATESSHQSTQKKILLTLIAIASVGGSMMTQARTALICFIAGWICYAIFLPKFSKRIFAYGVLTSIIWALLISPRFNVIQSDISKYENGSHSSSLGDRTDAIVWGFQHFFDKPWFGYGQELLRQAFNLRWVEWHQPEQSITKILHLHNDYLQLALSYGIPTLTLTLAFWLGLTKTIHKSSASKRQRAACKAMLTILATTSLVDSFTHWQGLWAMCVTCAAIAFTICRQPTDVENKYPNTL